MPLCRAKPSPSFINLPASSPPATSLNIQKTKPPSGKDLGRGEVSPRDPALDGEGLHAGSGLSSLPIDLVPTPGHWQLADCSGQLIAFSSGFDQFVLVSLFAYLLG